MKGVGTKGKLKVGSLDFGHRHSWMELLRTEAERIFRGIETRVVSWRLRCVSENQVEMSDWPVNMGP